jgi:hypothetical protein
MKGHATKKILVDLIQDNLDARKAAIIRQHISTCAVCCRNMEVLQSVMTPFADKKLKPSRSVLTRILAFHDSYVPGREPEPQPARQRSFFPQRLRIPALAAAAACACFVAYTMFTHLQFENAPLEASRVKGTVRADKNTLQKGQQLNPGVLLTTGENSKLALMYGKIMKLIAGPHTSLVITKSRIDRKTGKIYFEMVIDKGTIIAVFDPGWKLEYTLITPHGKVSSSGSKIALKVDSSKTSVEVKDGSANLSSTQGHSVNSEEGSGYSITNKEVTSAMEPSEEDKDSGTLFDNTSRDLQDDDDEDDTVIQ